MVPNGGYARRRMKFLYIYIYAGLRPSYEAHATHRPVWFA